MGAGRHGGKGIDPEKNSRDRFSRKSLFGGGPEASHLLEAGEPFRVLYFAQRSFRHAREELEAMLEADPAVYVTCILGRKFRRIYPHIRDLRAKYGKRLTVRGWTRCVPSYLTVNHVVVGKAGRRYGA